MMPNGRPPVGLVLGSSLPPEDIPTVARRGEELGFGELWLAEDYFFTGGISGATAVLAETKDVPVGLGIVSAMVRHPAVLAMEIATMARMYPGRVHPGIGLGVPAWVEQMGLTPPSQLSAMRECVGSVRRLLDGEELSESGKSFDFKQVKLTHPVSDRVPLYMGVVGPKMLKVSGEVADGTVISVLAGTDYVQWARKQIDEGRAASGRTDPHRIVTFAMFSVDQEGGAARHRLRGLMGFYLAAMAHSSLTEVYGIEDKVVALAADGPQSVAAGMEERWIDDLAVAGTPGECAERIEGLLEAGSDAVILFPVPPDEATSVIERAARDVLPLI
jgi:alkanesulfonate monooxygenase SsuD/methylene tetrahydromethanopterin reductase-like flavin-dependent oxidoreductase (luciferase family)